MEKLISEQIVDSILSQDKEAFVDAFNAAIAAKVSDALEVKKVEIASSLITPEMAVEEEVEQIEEVFRLFHPGNKAIITNIDKYGFTGRENHPPTDGSLNGHTIRITNYGDATGRYGVTSGYGGPRYQAVRGMVLTGKHKGNEFEFIQHELEDHPEGVKEEVEQVAEQSNDALANELLGFEAAKGKKVAGREEILNKKSAEENKAAAISNAVKDKVKAKLNKVDTKPVMNTNQNNQGK